MHPRDVVVHRLTAAAVAAGIVVIGVLRGPVMAIGTALSSGLPIFVLSMADRRYYGPPRKPDAPPATADSPQPG